MKNFMCAASFMLALAAAAPAAQATDSSNAKVPNLTSSGYSLNNPRDSYSGNYQIRVHVVGRGLAQLVIKAPTGVRLSEAIKLTDQSGKPINATVSLSGQKATIALAQVISPDTMLAIELKNVKTSIDPITWFFSVSSQLAGLNGEIGLGLARIQPQFRD